MSTIINLKCYLQNISISIRKTTIETEYLGADTELSPDIINLLDFASLTTDTDVEPVELDEYELAMAG